MTAVITTLVLTSAHQHMLCFHFFSSLIHFEIIAGRAGFKVSGGRKKALT